MDERDTGSVKKTKPAVQAAIYARYSSDTQSAHSAQDQIDRILDLAKRGQIQTRVYQDHEIEVQKEWLVKDEAITGKVVGRIGYQRILQGIRRRAFDLLIVDDLSRLTRSLGNLFDLYDLLQHHNVELVSVSDHLSSSDPNSRVNFFFKGAIADFGNEIHAERTKRGLEARARDGYSTGPKPYGFKSEATVPADKKRKASHYKLSINENEAQIVRRIYQIYAEGYGKTHITKMLNKEGVRPPQYNSKGWSTGPIHKILHNEKYIGRWVFNRVVYSFDPDTKKRVPRIKPRYEWLIKNREELRIVGQDLWDRVQVRLRENEEARRKYPPRSHKAIFGLRNRLDNLHLLSGVVTCEQCRGSLVIVSGRRDGYYGCLAAHRHGTCENRVLLRRRDIEKAVLDALVQNVVSNSTVIRYATDRYNQMVRSQLRLAPTRRVLLEKELAQLERQVENLVTFIAEGKASDIAALGEVLRDKENRKAKITEELSRLSQVDERKLLVTPYLVQSRLGAIVQTLSDKSDRYNALIREIFNGPLVLTEIDDEPVLKGYLDLERALCSTHCTVASPTGFEPVLPP